MGQQLEKNVERYLSSGDGHRQVTSGSNLEAPVN